MSILSPEQAEKNRKLFEQDKANEDHGLANALAWFQSIKEMVDALEKAETAETDDGGDAQERILESVLSVEVRSGWYSPAGGNADSAPAEYRILLTTGGPACQLVGELNEHGEPESARLEHQNWGTPWEEVHRMHLAKIDQRVDELLLTFARQFYFGEG